jgi:catechol 2,3-dioxygenase-like lactoylglutathione lyase family enzyme
LRPRWGLLGDHGAMDVLSSRLLLRPTDPERSRIFYRDTLGLAIYREFGSGPERGTVFFLGGGFLELSGRAAGPGHGVVAAGARAGRGAPGA